MVKVEVAINLRHFLFPNHFLKKKA